MANDYTAATNDDMAVNAIPITWKALHEADFTFNTPFYLTLEDNDIVEAHHVLRLVPKRRIVTYGTWQGHPVVAKIFFDKQHAHAQVEKELAGLTILQTNKIPTPQLYYHGVVDGRMEVLIFEYIPCATNLEEIWQQEKNTTEISPYFYNIMVELATHHVLGVIQRDLHLKNFLITEKMIYTLDGAAIEQEKQLLPKKTSIHNIALFLSQLGVGFEEIQEKLFKHYAKSRGWLVKPEDIIELFTQIKKWNAVRWASYSKKIFRDSTDFVTFKKNGFQGIYKRAYQSDALLAILQDPDSAFKHPEAQILKNGRSATVIKLKLNGQIFLIKRHNMKHFLHRIRRYFRTTRALKVWRLANKLALFSIPVAKPIAFLEKRFMGLHTRSYYFSECLDGISLGEYIQQHRHDDDKIALVAARITTLLKNITKLRIAHGDLKETNVLLTKDDEPILIDYDTAAEHVSLTRLKQAWKRDVKRLLKNFHNEPVIVRKFKEALT